MLEANDRMYADDMRCPYYNPRKHGFFAECAICGDLIHRENDSYSFLDEDDYFVFSKIGYAHDKCIERIEEEMEEAYE